MQRVRLSIRISSRRSSMILMPWWRWKWYNNGGVKVVRTIERGPVVWGKHKGCLFAG